MAAAAMSALDGHFGLILGAVIAAMLADGQEPEEIMAQADLALWTAQMVRDHPERARPMGAAAIKFAADPSLVLEDQWHPAG